MDDEILFISENHEPVESAAEVFQDPEEMPFPDVVETAEEVGFPDQEPSAAEYAASFGENVVYREERADDYTAYSGDGATSSTPDPVIVPVLDDGTINSIRNIESNTDSIMSYVSSIELYMSHIDEYIPEFDFKIAHIESDVRQIGKNNILFQKLSAGLIAALLGAIIVIIFFSKFR